MWELKLDASHGDRVYDIIYRQIKMVDGHSLGPGGLRVRTRSQNSSVTDHGF